MIGLETSSKRLGGRFIIESPIARGGSGVVYRGYDVVTEQTVALKVLAVEPGVAPREEERMAREGRLLQELRHPHIVRVMSFGVLEELGNVPYVAMEWLEGEDLAARHRRRPVTMAQAVELAIVVGEALEAAHAAGVIHRDVKPGNIFLCPGQVEWATHLDCYPKLLDFGLAARNDARVTRTGDMVGTPAYMAPEQARGDGTVDVRSDIYSLGATLFELVSGRPPHVGPTAIAMLARLVTTPAPRLRELRTDVSVQLDQLVAAMLATSADDRPSSMREVVDALAECVEQASRLSWIDPLGDTTSSRLGSSATRLVTSIVAIHFAKGSARERALDQLRHRGADAIPLGTDAIVAHLGARHAVGTEAAMALDLGRRLARAGAQVGIASGRIRVNWASDRHVQPVGEVVDRASALARDAQPGLVLADVTTSELGRGRYEFLSRDDGSTIVGEQRRGQRGERAGGAPFVGRDSELARVLSAFRRCASERVPIVVSITGPPGIGKTRLRREVVARVGALAEASVIVFQRSEAYARGNALGAAADVLRAMVGLSKGTSAKEAESAIVARLGAATSSELTAESRKLLAILLANEPLPEAFDPRGARDALWLAMTDLVLHLLDQPTAIIMEDLQWSDPESIGWLDHVMGRALGRPVLLLATVRPSFWGESENRFQGRDHVRIDLRPLSRDACRTIAHSLLGEAAASAEVDQIADQAAGLPLFAEELARLKAAGRNVAHAPTIEAAIQVSLDALDEECRDAVGRLSVFGQTCWDAGLEALGLPSAEGVMKELAATEVLIEQSVSRFTGTREWMFKHALVREVAYTALGESERRELHALAAEWLESMGEDAATVAGHYDLGGQEARAAERWAVAAKHALVANALGDALTMAERALMFAESRQVGFQRACLLDEAWSRLDPRAGERETAVSALEQNVHDEASSVLALGARARYDDARGAGEEVNARLILVRDQAARLGLHDEEARCSAALASRLAYAGEFEQAESEARRLLRIREERGAGVAAVDAWQAMAIVRQSRGALSLALEARRNAASAAREAGLREREAILMANLGFALTTIGARQEARTALLDGAALAEAIGSVAALRNAQMNLLGWSATFGRDRALDPYLSEARADADASAGGVWAATDRANLGVLFYRGCELVRSKVEGACARARLLLKMAAEGYRSAGFLDVLPAALGMWAEAERGCRDPQRAVALAQEAVALFEQGAPSLLNESAVYLVLHDAYTDTGDADKARDAVARGIPLLVRRLHGLINTSYARAFLTDLPANASFLAAAEGYGLVPEEIRRALESHVS